MYQKCPICEGSGYPFFLKNQPCNVCEGAGIIDERTGLPPEKDEKTITYLTDGKELEKNE